MQLIVLGMHRSGTSSVTRLLNLAGAYFGPEGIATDANDENPKGFWERRDVREVCDGLLHGGGFDWWRIADFSAEAIPEPVREEHTEMFRRIVLQLDAHRPWVMKEPRLSLLLPILRPTLEVPIFVHVTREPIEIAESLSARNGFPVPVGLALWESYTVNACTASTGEPRVHVSYGALMSDPIATTARLVEQLTDLGVQGLRLPTDREITAFITPSLHRQRQESTDRTGYLNAPQAALAINLDEDRLPEMSEVPPLSPGAAATLRAFEEQQALQADLEALQTQAEAERTRAEAEAARVAAAHREVLDDLAAAHAKVEADLRASAAQTVESSRGAEQHAIESLVVAAQKVRTVKGSGAVKLGGRLASVRARLRGRSTGGVDTTLQSALQQIQEARGALEGHLRSDRSLAVGVRLPEPLPVEELRIRRRAARARGDRAKVAVIAWDVGHNPFGRAHLLADLLRADFEVELWGAQFDRYGSDVWPPLRGTTIPVTRYPGSHFPEFLTTLEDMARRINADAIYVSKPRLPSLALGILAKEQWNRPLIVDVDDFELSFFDESEPLAIAELERHRKDPDLTLPFGRLWTRACESVVSAADQLTVSNLVLESRYGGAIVPHARDEAVFDPARYDRASVRRRLGLGDADRLVLFGGTPRAHKGIVQLLEALEALGDDHIRLGAFATRELHELRSEIGALERWILPLPTQSFNDLPGLIAAADLTCALQAPEHPVSRYQMPAKVSDAMAMGVPCLVTAVAPLQPLIDKDVVEVLGADEPLHERIHQIFADPEETADRARRAREVYLESFSYAAVRPLAVAAVERFLEDPPPLATSLASLVDAARDLFPSDTARRGTVARSAIATTPAERRPLPAGTTYDLAVFWKQNDTGIYGRRQDMFLKYLERSGRFHTIIHFDQPMSAKGLLHIARRSIGSNDQNGLVLRQTLRRLAKRSDRGAIRHRTFLYASGRLSRMLRLPSREGYTEYVQSVFQREGVGRRPLMCWVYPTNTWFPSIADALRPDVIVADVVDDNRTWYTPDTPAYARLSDNYAEVLTRSDVVLANCAPVAESMRSFVPRVDVIANACDLVEDMSRSDRPKDLAGLTGPIIGYAGNLSDRIDIPLLRKLVQARRDWSFVFLGSTHLDRSALHLATEPNVRFIGTKVYDDAQAIIRHFDVGLIPHIDNAMTRSMNPLKAYVYCSLGVPIVSTPVANLDEMSEFITIAEGADGFLAAIETAIASGRHAPDHARLLPHSWEQRVERVLALVDDTVSTRPVPGI